MISYNEEEEAVYLDPNYEFGKGEFSQEDHNTESFMFDTVEIWNFFTIDFSSIIIRKKIGISRKVKTLLYIY